MDEEGSNEGIGNHTHTSQQCRTLLDPPAQVWLHPGNGRTGSRSMPQASKQQLQMHKTVQMHSREGHTPEVESLDPGHNRVMSCWQDELLHTHCSQLLLQCRTTGYNT